MAQISSNEHTFCKFLEIEYSEDLLSRLKEVADSIFT
jgi:hypothetical protein